MNAGNHRPQAGHNKWSTCSSWQHTDYGGDSLRNRLAILDPILRNLLLPGPGISRMDYRLNTMCLTALKSVTKWHAPSTATLILLETEPTSSNSHANVPRYVSIPLTKPNSEFSSQAHRKGDSQFHTPNYSGNSHTEENPSAFVLQLLPVWAVLVNALIHGNNCNSPEKNCNASRAQLVTMLSAFCS